MDTKTTQRGHDQKYEEDHHKQKHKEDETKGRSTTITYHRSYCLWTLATKPI